MELQVFIGVVASAWTVPRSGVSGAGEALGGEIGAAAETVCAAEGGVGQMREAAYGGAAGGGIIVLGGRAPGGAVGGYVGHVERRHGCTRFMHKKGVVCGERGREKGGRKEREARKEGKADFSSLLFSLLRRFDFFHNYQVR